jgi:hypothetical protein
MLGIKSNDSQQNGDFICINKDNNEDNNDNKDEKTINENDRHYAPDFI